MRHLLLALAAAAVPDKMCYGCTSLRFFNAGGAATIGEAAYYGCTSLTSIAFSQTPATYKPPELLLEKTLGDVAVSGSTITLTLSQEDTLKLDAAHDVEIQLRVLCGDTAMASQIIKTPVRRILRDGVLA